MLYQRVSNDPCALRPMVEYKMGINKCCSKFCEFCAY